MRKVRGLYLHTLVLIDPAHGIQREQAQRVQHIRVGYFISFLISIVPIIHACDGFDSARSDVGALSANSSTRTPVSAMRLEADSLLASSPVVTRRAEMDGIPYVCRKHG